MEAKVALSEVQKDIQIQGVTEEKRQQEHEYKLKYMSLPKDEEAFYKQKSRVTWLNIGDKNTAFFRKMKGYQASNKILSIVGEDGQRIEGEENVHKEAIRFFSTISWGATTYYEWC